MQSISVSKDQRHIYTGSKDGTLKVRQSICFPLLGLALTICLLARCGSRVRLRPQSSRSRTRTCGTPVREQLRAPKKCQGFVKLGAGLLAGAMGLFAGKDASLGISEVYQSDFNRQAISCGADGRVVLWKDL